MIFTSTIRRTMQYHSRLAKANEGVPNLVLTDPCGPRRFELMNLTRTNRQFIPLTATGRTIYALDR